jgi:hypothetical protein
MMHHCKWNLENNINHLQHSEYNLDKAYKFSLSLYYNWSILQLIRCMDSIAHTSLPTWFQNKIWHIIGTKSKWKWNLPFKLFIDNN